MYAIMPQSVRVSLSTTRRGVSPGVHGIKERVDVGIAFPLRFVRGQGLGLGTVPRTWANHDSDIEHRRKKELHHLRYTTFRHHRHWAFEKFGVPGPRTVRYVMNFLSRWGGPLGYHYVWRKILGVSNSDWGVKEQEVLLVILDNLGCDDQLDITNLVGAETVCRWIQSIQFAYLERAREAEAATSSTSGASTSTSTQSKLSGIEEEFHMGRQNRDRHICYSPELKEYFSKTLGEDVNVRKNIQMDRPLRLEQAKNK